MSTKRSIHLANLGLMVFIVHYRADKLNLGEETQSGMALLIHSLTQTDINQLTFETTIGMLWYRETIPTLLSIKCEIGLLYALFLFIYYLWFLST